MCCVVGLVAAGGLHLYVWDFVGEERHTQGSAHERALVSERERRKRRGAQGAHTNVVALVAKPCIDGPLLRPQHHPASSWS
jgi:hypothetical protein